MERLLHSIVEVVGSVLRYSHPVNEENQFSYSQFLLDGNSFLARQKSLRAGFARAASVGDKVLVVIV